ncbi:hypothetical protein MHM582_0493 [Microbacterium sp. HM58-2]|nr:hypothetical protein MHM582_0493 [Microbacterium sp. HM58-2]
MAAVFVASTPSAQTRRRKASKNITADAVYHQVAVMPRASCRAPGAGSAAGIVEGVLLTRTTIRA